MAAFNIINVATINDGIYTLVPAPGATAMGAAPASGHVFEVGAIVAANTTGSTAAATVTLYDGSNYRSIATAISVPANATLIIVDKSYGLTLVDTSNQASGGAASQVFVTSGTSGALTFTMAFKDLS